MFEFIRRVLICRKDAGNLNGVGRGVICLRESVVLSAPMTLGRMLRPEHVGELLNEIHNERSLILVQAAQGIRDASQLIIEPLRSTLQ